MNLTSKISDLIVLGLAVNFSCVVGSGITPAFCTGGTGLHSRSQYKHY